MLFTYFSHMGQASTSESTREKCTCTLVNSEEAFPYDKLGKMEKDVLKCNNEVTPQKVPFTITFAIIKYKYKDCPYECIHCVSFM